MRTLHLLAASALAAGCLSATAPRESLVVETDRQRYGRPSADSLALIRFTARNAGAGELYLPRCGPSVSLYA